ncbi:MAG TPA: hypothetical protein VE968_00040 [Sphingomicrobium sp.]|nr:hypothetical protein [Sphingomicrobium sp.]
MAAAIIVAALPLAVAPAQAAAKEPLIVTRMADPDPNFVPSSDDSLRRKTHKTEAADENSRIDEAMMNFGRAIGQAALIEQRQIETKCRQGPGESSTPEQRFDWAATCRYTRH